MTASKDEKKDKKSSFMDLKKGSKSRQNVSGKVNIIKSVPVKSLLGSVVSNPIKTSKEKRPKKSQTHSSLDSDPWDQRTYYNSPDVFVVGTPDSPSENIKNVRKHRRSTTKDTTQNVNSRKMYATKSKTRITSETPKRLLSTGTSGRNIKTTNSSEVDSDEKGTCCKPTNIPSDPGNNLKSVPIEEMLGKCCSKSNASESTTEQTGTKSTEQTGAKSTAIGSQCRKCAPEQVTPDDKSTTSITCSPKTKTSASETSETPSASSMCNDESCDCDSCIKKIQAEKLKAKPSTGIPSDQQLRKTSCSACLKEAKEMAPATSVPSVTIPACQECIREAQAKGQATSSSNMKSVSDQCLKEIPTASPSDASKTLQPSSSSSAQAANCPPTATCSKTGTGGLTDGTTPGSNCLPPPTCSKTGTGGVTDGTTPVTTKDSCPPPCSRQVTAGPTSNQSTSSSAPSNIQGSAASCKRTCSSRSSMESTSDKPTSTSLNVPVSPGSNGTCSLPHPQNSSAGSTSNQTTSSSKTCPPPCVQHKTSSSSTSTSAPTSSHADGICKDCSAHSSDQHTLKKSVSESSQPSACQPCSGATATPAHTASTHTNGNVCVPSSAHSSDHHILKKSVSRSSVTNTCPACTGTATSSGSSNTGNTATCKTPSTHPSEEHTFKKTLTSSQILPQSDACQPCQGTAHSAVTPTCEPKDSTGQSSSSRTNGSCKECLKTTVAKPSQPPHHSSSSCKECSRTAALKPSQPEHTCNRASSANETGSTCKDCLGAAVGKPSQPLQNDEKSSNASSSCKECLGAAVAKPSQPEKTCADSSTSTQTEKKKCNLLDIIPECSSPIDSEKQAEEDVNRMISEGSPINGPSDTFGKADCFYTIETNQNGNFTTVEEEPGECCKPGGLTNASGCPQMKCSIPTTTAPPISEIPENCVKTASNEDESSEDEDNEDGGNKDGGNDDADNKDGGNEDANNADASNEDTSNADASNEDTDAGNEDASDENGKNLTTCPPGFVWVPDDEPTAAPSGRKKDEQIARKKSARSHSRHKKKTQKKAPRGSRRRTIPSDEMPSVTPAGTCQKIPLFRSNRSSRIRQKLKPPLGTCGRRKMSSPDSQEQRLRGRINYRNIPHVPVRLTHGEHLRRQHIEEYRERLLARLNKRKKPFKFQ